jgi:hypothetical protein
VAVGQSQRFYSGVGIFNWYCLSLPPQVLRFPVVGLGLESGGLIWLAIYYAYIIGYKRRTWTVRPVPPAFYVAALLLLSLPYLTSITNI